MYAAHAGWLSSDVKISKGKGDSESKTKFQYFGGKSLICRMPELGKLEYIAEHWEACGRYEVNGFSFSALSPSSIRDYAAISGLSKWESLLIHSMSRMFVTSKLMFDDVLCECPYRYKDKPMLELQLLASRDLMIINKPS